MSDEGEKTCPLCAEEMDLTDQQLKPCKCGYEICVWCWHHIMEMAEKNESEGRCPACRTPYDKERIVGTASKCERLVTEISMEKKVKSQKAKTKSSDGRKQLSSVRVIQRNLVYIVGLPLNLADEDLLTGKEYFAQYGKILKVSISRTSAGTIQQFANNSCSVYITYSKEEEAVRCIQSVHGFNLEGRSLRACFGTTKYCHAWLRSVPCTNAECLYLHEIGSTEDSFTKDEVISAYSRSRVQQITGISNNVQRRAGAVLPAPADDYYSDCSTASTGKPVMKSTTSNVVSNSRVLPPASIANKTGVLPPAASWGTRASNCMSSAGSIVHSNGSTKQKLDTVAGMPLTLTGAATATMKSMDVVRKVKMNEDILSRELKSKLELSENGRKHGSINLRNGALESSNTPLRESAGMVSIGRIPSPSRSLNSSKIKGSFDELANASTVKEKPTASEGKIGKNGKRCSESINSDDQLGSKVHEAGIANTLVYDNSLVSGNKRPQLHCDTEKLQDDLTPSLSEAASSDATTSVDLSGCSGASSGSDIHASARPNLSSETDDFDSQRLSDPIVAIPTNPSLPPNLLNNLLSPSGLHRDAATVVNHNINPPFVHKNADNSLLSSASNPSNGFLDNTIGYSSGIGSSVLLPYGGVEGQLINSNDIDLNTGVDAIENSIISNILSLDLDAWDEPLTSQNLVKLLGESERQQGSLNVANSWRAQSSNQSRFSFARQDSRSQMIDAEPSFNCDVMRTHSFVPTFVENRDPCLDRRMNGFGIPHHNVDSFHSNQSAYSANMPNTSRAQISAPPGFAASSRVPPPGFSSHDRNGQSFDMNSGNNHFGTSSALRHPYQPSASTNSSLPTDIEFIDPAILAVGKGRVPNGLNNSSLDARSNISPQSMGFESNSGLQLLMQRSLSAQQSQIFGDVLDNGNLHDGYGFTARSLEPSQANNVSPFSQFSLQPRNGVTPNGHYDAWPDVNSGNSTGISDLLRNDRLCFNKFYGGYEDPKFQISSSGDLYNRTFGI